MLRTFSSRLAAAIPSSIGAVMFAGPLLAADLGGQAKSLPPIEPTYADAYAAPIVPWSGLYAGISLGYGWGEATQTYERAGDHGTASLSPDGAAGALTLGYNVPWGNGLVLGVEGDLGLMDLTAGPETVFDGHIYSAEFGPLWGTLRGRAGVTFGDTLVYGTAGLAFMEVDEISIGNTPGETATSSDTRLGWVLGAGVEHLIGPRTSLKLEYLHLDVGSSDGRSANDEAFSFEETADLIRAGVNYRF